MSRPVEATKQNQVNRIILFTGLTLVILAILPFFIFSLRGLESLIGLQIFLWPVGIIMDPFFFTIFTTLLTGLSMTLISVLERDRRHGWGTLIPYLFLFGTLLKDSIITNLGFLGWLPFHGYFGNLAVLSGLVELDGSLVFVLAFLIAWYRGGGLRGQAVFWVYLALGVIIFFNGVYMPSPKSY
ncbi:MAG: hypothetical protein ABSA11_10425 [Candidatus Bathyarchaeia archaeon]|jgi:hypothetical protein